MSTAGSFCLLNFSGVVSPFPVKIFRPYNKKISAVQNTVVAMITFGEGWHNFHHAFPTDFRCSDQWYQWNPTRWFIRGCEMLGLARNLKIRNRRVVD